MQTESANHAESTYGDAQEKSARCYKLEFAPNEKSVNSKFGAHFVWPVITFEYENTVIKARQKHCYCSKLWHLNKTNPTG